LRYEVTPLYDEGSVMARPLLFEVKLTDAERSKRYRDGRRQKLKEKVTPPKERKGKVAATQQGAKPGRAVPVVTSS
jgi:hypothetical protein